MHSQQIFPSGLPSPDAGELKPLNSPPREDRIAAIRLTAAQLKQRLEKEAFRLGLNLQTAGVGKTDDRLPSVSAAQTREYPVFKGALPGIELDCSKAWFPCDRNDRWDSGTAIAAIIWKLLIARILLLLGSYGNQAQLRIT